MRILSEMLLEFYKNMKVYFLKPKFHPQIIQFRVSNKMLDKIDAYRNYQEDLLIV